MPTLADIQNSLIATVNNGPDTFTPALYKGPIERVLLAIQSHANTNSYARLTALEDSFPLTRQYHGARNFHQLCRSYCSTTSARADDLNALGETLVAYMESQNLTADIIELAQVEWAWLHSYHAPDAVALSLPEIAEMNSAELLSFGIGLHPSVRIVPITAPLAPPLMEQIETSENTVALAVLRPTNEVKILALDALSNQLMSITAQKNAVIGNLLSCVLEYSSNDAPLAPILRLISAGALIGIPTA
jgi:hypothetical protein